ncbi:MAG: fatty acid desaturase family protein [Deltaproteobacteria bacterium]|nr:fatty acid desaturase family protein [Deltaproteobacteria bacterium]
MADPIQHRAAAELAAGYKLSHRVAELGAMAVFAVLISVFLSRVVRAGFERPVHAVLGLMIGYLLADFVSGLVHWFCDTWGSPEWFVVGPVFIRTFREHHVDPLSITRHDFVETNGANCMSVLVALVPAMWFQVDPSVSWRVVFAAVLAGFILCIPCTSQAHKWAHMEPHLVPTIPRLMQRAGLLLSRQHHDQHHVAPFVKNYCITTGLCDHLLERVGFFPTLERWITRITGALPREDDIGARAATALMADSDRDEPNATHSLAQLPPSR